MAEPELQLSQEEVDYIFNAIDLDADGQIDKMEMECFLKILMIIQQNLTFKSSNQYFK